MWALTKYCAERTHFTHNIPLKILLSLLTAVVAVASYTVVFAFVVLKLVATGLHKGWLALNNPEVHAKVMELDDEDEDRRVANNAYWDEHYKRLAAIDDDCQRLHDDD